MGQKNNSVTVSVVEMYRRVRCFVSPGYCIRTFVPSLGLFLVALGCLGSCVEVKGGAVELSWALRSFAGEPIGTSTADACRRSNIDQIRLSYEKNDGSSSLFQDFPCNKETGVTPFEIDPGETALFIRPFCLPTTSSPNGTFAQGGTFEAPSPIVRNIVDGQVVTLNTLLLIVTDNQLINHEQFCPASGCTCE